MFILEKMYYETKPFICVSLALLCLQMQKHQISVKLTAIFLLTAGLVILFMRGKARGYIK